MPENEFEKQVQQKMNELQFVPSAQAWEKVEKEIANNKKRRRFLLLLPLLLLLMSGGAWYFSSNSPVAPKHSSANHATDEQTASHAAPVTGTGDKAVAPESLAANGKQVAVTNKPAGKTATADAHTTQNAENKKQPVYSVPRNMNPPVLDKDKNAITAHTVSHRVKDLKPLSIDGGSEKSIIRSADRPGKQTLFTKKPLIETMGNTVGKPVPSPSIVQRQEAGDNNDKPDQTGMSMPAGLPAGKQAAPSTENKTAAVPVMDSTHNSAVAANKQPAAVKHRRVSWGINVNTGISSLSDGLGGLFQEKALNTNTFASLPQNSFVGSLSNSVGYTGPSAVTKRFAWGAGIFIRKPLSGTLALSGGINYQYLATHMTVGSAITSLNSALLYRNARTTAYTNRFHFIELPVQAEYQFGKTSRFSMEGGFSFSYLMATQALLYDPQKNRYASGEDQVNKFQWGLLAGLHYRVLQKGIRLELGPELNYKLSRAFTAGATGNGHWLFAGIHTKISFQRR